MADIDHRYMLPPFLRIMEQVQGKNGDTVHLWDLRIAQPNVSHVEMRAIHSIEHLLTIEMRRLSNRVLNVGPMGCQTGFYITTVALDNPDEMAELLSQALQAILDAEKVPLANVGTCGWAANHSLSEAKSVASWLLSKRSEWGTASSNSTEDQVSVGDDD
ncbi:S-ribosylhomocysteine lyase [Micromonospora purpureochromogenes]|uniref:S-ribosylhomocysteine lyase n=1 Tax=Micromonospora purpureochromogenes TaxID=47872 RepID=UPI00340BC9C3